MKKYLNYSILAKLRVKLIKLLISNDLKIISNITFTSDIIEYNNGIDILINTNVKEVSDRQSFVFNPNVTIECY